MRNFERSLASFLFFVLASFALYKSVYIPYKNWDMITYIAAAKSFEEQDIDILHSFANDHLRLSVSRSQYKALVNGEFRHMVAADRSVLKKLLPL
jgi:hypothetical protein